MTITTKRHRASGHTAVMSSRGEPPDSLDFFPTPPWATRALMTHVLRASDMDGATAWDPAAGQGHMSEVLAEGFAEVEASDVHDYGRGYRVGSFVGCGADVIEPKLRPDWIITNPPFRLALEFAERAMMIARTGVALLVRTAWLESSSRYERLFSILPPDEVALFVERVPMVKGRWDPEASTATSYCWVVWRSGGRNLVSSRLTWIPPGCRSRLARPDDTRRFAGERLP